MKSLLIYSVSYLNLEGLNSPMSTVATELVEISLMLSGETDGGASVWPVISMAGHFEVFGPPVTTLLILLSDL